MIYVRVNDRSFPKGEVTDEYDFVFNRARLSSSRVSFSPLSSFSPSRVGDANVGILIAWNSSISLFRAQDSRLNDPIAEPCVFCGQPYCLQPQGSEPSYAPTRR